VQVTTAKSFRLRGHDQLIRVQASNIVRSLDEIQIVSIPKILVCGLLINWLVARNHKYLVDRPSINLEIVTNQKILLLLSVD